MERFRIEPRRLQHRLIKHLLGRRQLERDRLAASFDGSVEDGSPGLDPPSPLACLRKPGGRKLPAIAARLPQLSLRHHASSLSAAAVFAGHPAAIGAQVGRRGSQLQRAIKNE